MSIGTPLLSSLEARVEAAIFASKKPVQESEIRELLPSQVDISKTIEKIVDFWSDRGVRIERVAGGWKAVSAKEFLPKDVDEDGRRLSDAAISTLAIIAMHQPITVKQIEKIRKVKLARGIVENLIATGMVREVSRRNTTGKAVAFGVTGKFLERFSLESLSNLPTPEEVFVLDLEVDQSMF